MKFKDRFGMATLPNLCKFQGFTRSFQEGGENSRNFQEQSLNSTSFPELLEFQESEETLLTVSECMTSRAGPYAPQKTCTAPLGRRPTETTSNESCISHGHTTNLGSLNEETTPLKNICIFSYFE